MKGNLADITTPGLRSRVAPALINGAQRPLFGEEPPAPAPVVPIRRGDPPFLSIGQTDKGADAFLSLPGLLAGRCLVQGTSGAGKSYALRRLVEQAHRHVTSIIVDPDGEFGNLADHIGAVRVQGASTTADGLTAVAMRIRQHRVPVLLDLSDTEADVRIEKAAAFFAGLVSAPREHWGNTSVVFVDEAHLLAPHLAASARDAETRRMGIASLTDLVSRGRKRGLSVVIATQRLAKLATSVRSELHNMLIGLNMLDRDVASAADLLGWSYDKASMLRELKAGEFIGLGPAICTYPQTVRIAPTETQHLGGTPNLVGAGGLDIEAARAVLELDQMIETPGQSRVESRGASTRLLDLFLLDDRAPIATRILAALVPIAPNATTTEELSSKLAIAPNLVEPAIDLLAQMGVVDTMPRPPTSALAQPTRIARLSARLRIKAVPAKVVGLA